MKRVIKYEAKRLDFDDRILESVRLFRESERFARLWRARWHYVRVDEFQDVNRSRPELMREFRQVYPEAAVYMLERNYRSHEWIVDLVEQVMGLNRGRQLEKWVVAERETPEHAIAQVYEAVNEVEEAKWAAQTS